VSLLGSPLGAYLSLSSYSLSAFSLASHSYSKS
jgi:hypothetical protein